MHEIDLPLLEPPPPQREGLDLSRHLAGELRDRTETLRRNEMFHALLAHDLRDPLSAILASAQLLERSSADQAAQDAAARILASGRRMRRLIEDMLDLARSRLAGGIVIEPESTDLRSLLERVLCEQRSAAPARRIESCFAGDCTGRWDGERLAQVASNLIGNAVKHGDPSAPVEVSLDGTRSDEVELKVANRGRIPDALRAHLFDPFSGAERRAGADHGRRAGTDHEERRSGGGHGLGLGLYIVDQIVTAHHGCVALDPGADDRTVFRVTLPRAA